MTVSKFLPLSIIIPFGIKKSLINLNALQTIESQTFTGKNEKFPDDLLILSCEEDYADCVPFLRKGTDLSPF